MANYASVVIQDLTYTAKAYNPGLTITYTNTGTAGSEVVTVSVASTGVKNISIAIESGVSTATQIRAAVIAHTEANSLVTCTVSGTGSTVQLSAVSAPLAGGAAVATATGTFGDLVVTAVTAGTAGNDVRFRYTSGATAGSEVVSVSTNDISVQIANGVSTLAQIRTAIANSGAAAALVTTASSGASAAKAQLTANAASYTNLTGGVAAAAPEVVVQDLTFAGDATGASLNGKTVTYEDSATAGAETVTVTSGDVVVGIESGVSTATQVKTALDASATFNGVAATGTITVTQRAQLRLTKASGTIDTAVGYASLHLTKASGTVTYGSPDVLTAAQRDVVVEDYTKSIQATATPSGTITYGAPSDGSTVVVTGPGGGPYTFTKVAADPEANQFASIAQLTSLLQTISGIDASDDATTITLMVETAGTGPNAWTVTGTSSYVALSITFSGGQNHTTVTVNGTPLVQGTDWTAETDNDVTATNLAAAITGVTGVDASAAADTVTVVAATAGTAGNSITLATSDAAAVSVAGATLAGGLAASTVTVAGTTFTCVAAAPGANEFSAIAELTTLINGLATVDATDNATVITVVAATAGTAGNAITLAKTGSGLTTSGAVLTGGINAATVTVNGVVKTESADWNAETSDAVTATNIAAVVTGITGVDATATDTVVDIVAATAGTAGNSIAIACSWDDSLGTYISAATLEGGVNAATVTINGTVLTESTNWDSLTNSDTAATNLASAINALANVSAAAVTNVVTITADAKSTAGNAITVATSDAVRLLKSGATLAGGTDVYTVSVSGTGSTAQVTVNGVATTGAVGADQRTQSYFANAAATALTASFVRFEFGFYATSLRILCDETTGAKGVVFSYDGSATAGTLLFGEEALLEFENTVGPNAIYLKYVSAAPAYHVEATA